MTTNISEKYRNWMVQGNSDRAVIETITIDHPSLGAPIYLANWDVDIVATLEDIDPVQGVTFKASRFIMEPAAVRDGTEQNTTLVMGNYDGQVYAALKAMTSEEREQPVTIRPRMYLSDNLSEQLVNPSPIWNLHNVTASFEAVNGEIAAAPLRVQRIGLYYTALEFPVLAVIS